MASLSPEAQRVNSSIRLLPQPGGFEGFGWLREEPDVNNFASLHPLDYAKRDVEVDAAGSPASPEPADAHDLLSGVSRLVDLESHVFKVLRHLVEKSLQPVVTPMALAFQLRAQGIELRLLVPDTA